MDEITSILIVDDDEAIREYLKVVIEKMGYAVSAAADGIEALGYLHQNPTTDLVLLDVIMPEMTGLDVLRKIKDDPDLKSIIVIMVTGVHHIAEKELAFMSGASDYLEKPFETRELIARVRTHINLKKATEKCIIQKKIQETILSTVPGVVYMKSRDGMYIHGNEMFGRLVGKPIEYIVGKAESDLFPEPTASDRTRTDELILNLGVPELEMQEEIKNQSGETRFFFTRKRPVFDEKNSLKGLVGVSIDITEQVILKEAYYEKEELLTAILNTHPSEIWVINPDKEMILQNNDHLFKYGNLIGEKLDQMSIPDETRKIWSDGFDDAFAGKTKMEEDCVVDSNGPKWTVHIISPVSTDEKILGVMGMSFDITRWKENSAEPGLPSDFILPILDTFPEPVIGIDTSAKKILIANHSAQQLLHVKEGITDNLWIYHLQKDGEICHPEAGGFDKSDKLRVQWDDTVRDAFYIGKTRFYDQEVYLLNISTKHHSNDPSEVKPESSRTGDGE